MFFCIENLKMSFFIFESKTRTQTFTPELVKDMLLQTVVLCWIWRIFKYLIIKAKFVPMICPLKVSILLTPNRNRFNASEPRFIPSFWQLKYFAYESLWNICYHYWKPQMHQLSFSKLYKGNKQMKLALLCFIQMCRDA